VAHVQRLPAFVFANLDDTCIAGEAAGGWWSPVPAGTRRATAEKNRRGDERKLALRSRRLTASRPVDV